MDEVLRHAWVILRFSISGDQLRITYRDSRRRLFRVGEVNARDRLVPKLQGLIRELPDQHWNTEQSGPVPLALFLDPSGIFDYDTCERFTRDLIAGVDLARIQFAWLRKGEPARRRRFRLPFRIHAAEPWLAALLQTMRGRHQWIQEAEGEGIQLHSDWGNADLLLATGSLPDVSDLPVERRPRVMMSLNPFELPALSAAPGYSAIYAVVDRHRAEEFVYQFILSLVHDFPVHEALHSAATPLRPVKGCILITDPIANQNLRILDAADRIRHQATELGSRSTRTDVNAFIRRLRPEQAVKYSELLRAAYLPVSGLSGIVNEASNAVIEFSAESRGLVPLARVRSGLRFARQQQKTVDQSLLAMARDPQIEQLFTEHQDRRVDVTMQRLDTQPLLSNVAPVQALRRGSRYRLRLQVGHRADQSLMQGEPPPLDPLLPDTEEPRGHLLEVAVHEKDFYLLSRRVKRMWLPHLGASKPAFFTVRAPRRNGAARLRISIYHKNHLLQSFLLESVVDLTEGWAASPRLQVKLEYSRTERFQNLDDLAPRALAISMNQTQGTHEIQLKEGDDAKPIRLSPDVFDKEMSLFRDILNEATFELTPKGKRRERQYPNAAAYEDAIRKLAARGSDLYDAMFLRAGTELQAKLRAFKKDENKTVQVTRYDPNFVFPWSVVYDYRLPRGNGIGLPPICGDPDVCGHKPGDPVICLNGFWGVRHRIEELLGAGELKDTVRSVHRAADDGAIRIAADPGITQGVEIRDHLITQLGKDRIAWGPDHEKELLDALWSEKDRPSVLVVLGHLDGQPQAHGTSLPRIALGEQEWLFAKSLAEKFEDDAGWGQPNTLVMLMACSSGATTKETLANFETILNQVGAAAVVGTEINVYSGFVASFAKKVLVAMWRDGQQLGEALRQFRREMLKAGNPLGFVLHCVGNNDLKVGK